MYIIPGNPLVTDEKLPYWHEHLLKDDPNISKALGKKAKLERMKAGMHFKYGCDYNWLCGVFGHY